jgi:hypothetical protein
MLFGICAATTGSDAEAGPGGCALVSMAAELAVACRPAAMASSPAGSAQPAPGAAGQQRGLALRACARLGQRGKLIVP